MAERTVILATVQNSAISLCLARRRETGFRRLFFFFVSAESQGESRCTKLKRKRNETSERFLTPRRQTAKATRQRQTPIALQAEAFSSKKAMMMHWKKMRSR